MSDIAARAPYPRLATAALVTAAAAWAAWFAAEAIDEGLWLVTMIAGFAALAMGVSVRRGRGRRAALAAAIVGGLPATAVFVFFVLWLAGVQD